MAVTERLLKAIAKITTPSNPIAGFMYRYFKSDGRLYSLDENGLETCINSKGYVIHGSNAGTARPNFVSVEWRGTVQPSNAISGDTWVEG